MRNKRDISKTLKNNVWHLINNSDMLAITSMPWGGELFSNSPLPLLRVAILRMPMPGPSILYPGDPKLPFFSAEFWIEAGRWALSCKLFIRPCFLPPKQNSLGPSFCQTSSLWLLLVSGPLFSIYEGSNPDLVPRQGADPILSSSFYYLLLLLAKLLSFPLITKQMLPYIASEHAKGMGDKSIFDTINVRF